MNPSERSSRILAALVREYISSGEPVPSSLLVKAAGLGVSSATVRNIVAPVHGVDIGKPANALDGEFYLSATEIDRGDLKGQTIFYDVKNPEIA